jgi:hypothetical protein
MSLARALLAISGTQKGHEMNTKVKRQLKKLAAV